MDKIDGTGKVTKIEKAEDKEEKGGAETSNPFLCKGKHQEEEDCKECNHSPGEVTKQTRGVSSADVLAFLYTKPHSLHTIEEMKATLEKCYVPDCGTPFFLKDEDKEWVRNEFAILPDSVEKAYLIVKLSLIGCDDMVPEGVLHAVSGAMDHLAYLQRRMQRLRRT